MLLYVWATWCGVCRYTTPSVAALANDGGNVDDGSATLRRQRRLARWLAHKKMALPTINDASGQLSQRWEVQVTPTYRYPRGEVKCHHRLDQRLGMRLRLWLASAHFCCA